MSRMFRLADRIGENSHIAGVPVIRGVRSRDESPEKADCATECVHFQNYVYTMTERTKGFVWLG